MQPLCLFLLLAGAAFAATDVQVKFVLKTTDASMAAITVGVPFSYQILTSGGTAPLLFSAVGLPDGWAVDSATGLSSGCVAIAMDVSNCVGHFSAVLTVVVADAA